MKSHLGHLVLTVLFVVAGCEEPPKDSEGHLYEFICEKRVECNNKNGLVQVIYGVLNGKPDLSKSETFIFCCDDLAESIDSLKSYRELLAPFNDSLTGRVLTSINADTLVRKFIKTFYFDEGEDSVCIDLSPVFVISTLTFKEMLISIGHKRTGRIFLQFKGMKELDEYIELLEDNYRNCCI